MQHKSLDLQNISLAEFIAPVFKNKYKILLVSFVFSVFSVFYALSLPNIYKSETLLVPNSGQAEGGMAKLASSLGGLASLTGVNLGDAGANELLITIETLKSRNFILDFINENNLEVPLIAAVGWDKASNDLILDPEVYSYEEKKWVRGPTKWGKVEPSEQELYERFMERLSVNFIEDKSMLSLSMKHYSPNLSKEWLELYVARINTWMRNKKLMEAEKSILSLESIIQDTKLSNAKSVFSSLMEEQIQSKMLVMSKTDYALQIIDPPYLPELKSEPKRALICIFITFLGGFLSVVFYLVRAHT
ncbi:Wzz/FepE/Etk N-terminal domain-containing protein [Pseudoalteromonas piratica]|uniref:Polysaccharide chain length determinant N-terminal domain-containing protein n=1 Tax=Pseudoalteromonas piratica TaxID=1348114 RepID=A0A0A7EES5_9GAMM|nr:Wzz/FepE/Etk N-terminal domain-containing protein [Pseudoalteromonas piratica]AIY64571.1 hypothetical protein OM33_04970 [Pseudoalteromonas piratica]